VVENQLLGSILDTQQMIGQIVGKGNSDARDVCDGPGIK
jgi:hypothetical protein